MKRWLMALLARFDRMDGPGSATVNEHMADVAQHGHAALARAERALTRVDLVIAEYRAIELRRRR